MRMKIEDSDSKPPNPNKIPMSDFQHRNAGLKTGVPSESELHPLGFRILLGFRGSDLGSPLP
jgi:hypothetical protein